MVAFVSGIFASTLLGLGALPLPDSGSVRMAKAHWDWTGIIGTGQSLSVGARAMPVLSTEQPYHNLKLSTGDLAWPIEAADARLTLVPLVEPIGRLAPDYPSSWPRNIDGETPHTAAASQITALYQAQYHRDFVSVHSAVGEDGQGMIHLKKGAPHDGLNGRSFEAGLIETAAIARLAKAAGKTYGVAALFVTHGETDCGNANYEKELHQLWLDYNTDLRKITGQKQDILMLVSQQNSVMDDALSTQAQWKIGFDHPDTIVCSGPKYQYPYFTDGVHLNAEGYRMLGEKYGQVFYERSISGKRWRPLEPLAVSRKGVAITVRFHVPVGPLAWDSTFDKPHAATPEWSRGKGFEVRTASGAKVTIESAEIEKGGKSVVLVCASDPGPGARVSYAMVGEKAARVAPVGGTTRWGLLKDSDSFVGATTKQRQPNYCVAFELKAP